MKSNCFRPFNLKVQGLNVLCVKKIKFPTVIKISFLKFNNQNRIYLLNQPEIVKFRTQDYRLKSNNLKIRFKKPAFYISMIRKI